MPHCIVLSLRGVCVYVSSLAAGIHQPQHVGAFSHGFSVLEMFVVANRIDCEQNESTDGVWWWHQPSELSHQPHVAIAISISKYTTHKHLITSFQIKRSTTKTEKTRDNDVNRIRNVCSITKLAQMKKEAKESDKQTLL